MKREIIAIATLLLGATLTFAGKVGVPPSPLSPENYNGGQGYYRGPDINTLVGKPITHQPNYYVFGSGLYWDLEDDHVSEEIAIIDNVSGQVLLDSGQTIGEDYIPGFRVGIGAWFDQEQHIGIEATGFYVPESDTDLVIQSGPDELGIPVRDGLGSFETTADSVRIFNEVELAGIDVAAKGRIFRSENFSANWIGGLKYLYFSDETRFDTASTTNGNTSDTFNADTHFIGALAGVEVRAEIEGFFFEANTRLGVGASIMDQELSADDVGLFNQPSEFGSYTEVEFAVAMEAGVKFGYDINDFVEIYAGYSVLYWSSVQRTLRNINNDVSLVNGTASEVDGSEFVAHGAEGGVKFKF